MRIIGIETSCDETAAGVVEDGRHLLSNVISSQEHLHAQYGGIVPEVAAREHLLALPATIRTALERAGTDWEQIDAIAVTHGPGLAGSLLTGLSYAKGLSYALGLPLVPVNHLEGHLYANWLDAPEPEFPAVALIVSGGHTALFLASGHGTYQRLGGTLDDAAGEAFDKVARLLGLGFPGGPAIQRAAAALGASPRSFQLPRAWLPGTADFSFSGLKTATLHLLQRLEREGEPAPVAEIAAAFQGAVIEVLVAKTVAAVAEHGARSVLLGGGVAANLMLREVLAERAPVPVRVAPVALCTDNGAMIAAAGYFRFHAGDRGSLDLDVAPNLPLTALPI